MDTTKIILSGVTWDDFWDKMREVAQESPEVDIRPAEERKLIRRSEVRGILHLTDPTIISWEKDGILNPIRIKGRILYDKDEIMAMADKHKQDSLL